jgi:hypothetical protein
MLTSILTLKQLSSGFKTLQMKFRQLFNLNLRTEKAWLKAYVLVKMGPGWVNL